MPTTQSHTNFAAPVVRELPAPRPTADPETW